MVIIDESIEYVITLAEDAVYDGDYNQASRLLNNALYDEPGYAKLHYTLAWMYHYYQFNEPKAVRHYELTFYFDPTCEYAFRQLVELLMDKKRYEAVKAQLTKAENAGYIEKDFIYEGLGHLAEKLADYRSAIGYYRRALMHSMDNGASKELKQNIKRTKFKKFKTDWRWRRQN
jgi:Tfp pilus assembly protein PilF